MYEYGKTIEVPEKAHDPLAIKVTQRFNEALRWQSHENIGGKAIRGVLYDCYNQFNGILSCEDQKIVEEVGVDAYVNLTAMKCNLVQSFLAEIMIQGGNLPWVINPTPIPDLSQSGRMLALEMVKEAIYGGNFNGSMIDLLTQIKTTVMRKEWDQAKLNAENMERLINDQCLEGGWNNAMFGFLTDFVVYPFAVLQGPRPVRRPRLQWVGDNVRVKHETYYEFKSVSPWDFWYSGDSPDTQRGTGVFVRERWNKQTLMDAAGMKSFLRDNIIKVLEEIEDHNQNGFDFKWLSDNPDQPDDILKMWKNCTATVDVLVHYGFFSGRELREYGVSGVEDLAFYNATVTVINGYTIQVVVPRNPNIDQRPIFTASFYKTHDRIANYGIAQRIRDVERAYMTTLRYLIANAAGASGPIAEADYLRLSRYMSEEDFGRLIPNTMYLADSEVASSSPALRLYSIPSVMTQYIQVANYFMDLTHLVTNIPAALHGMAQGSGANRTFRGAAMLQGNATKSLQAAVFNIEQQAFAPLGTLLYNYNMLYEDDESIKGDCKVLAQGATGQIEREVKRQSSYETAAFVAQMAQVLVQQPGGAQTIAWAINDALSNMGVPKDVLPGVPSQQGVSGPTGGGEPQVTAPEGPA